MSLQVSNSVYTPLKVPFDPREILEKATHTFSQILGLEESKCCKAIKALENEHEGFAQAAREALEDDAKNFSVSFGTTMYGVGFFIIDTTVAGLTVRGLLYLLPEQQINRKTCLIASLIIGIAYGILRGLRLLNENDPWQISDNLEIRTRAELRWIKTKVQWIDKVLAKNQDEVDPLDDSTKDQKNAEVFQLTTLRTYFVLTLESNPSYIEQNN
jgi:hypothetical protein